nr:putative RNA polymerase II subunit B1 CTD phosphatase RPAP2 isoform X1 [Megalopta genalis]
MATSTLIQESSERKKVKKKLSKAQVQLAIIKKKKCDAKALAIVELLLEPNIDDQWLLQNLRYINKCHMEDVIEERAVIKLCGYVLCSNALVVVINQQYHISTKRNKVYDVTRRKNFCSSRCYGACNYLLEQMLTSPLWLRDKEEIPNFKLLPAKDVLQRSIPGDEIQVMDTTAIVNPKNENNINCNATCTNLEEIEIKKALTNKCSITQADNKSDIIVNNDININTTEISSNSEIYEDQLLRDSVENCDDTEGELYSLKDTTDDIKQSSTDMAKSELILQNDITMNNIKIQNKNESRTDIIYKSQTENNIEVQNELTNTLVTTCNTAAVEENTLTKDTNDLENVEKYRSKKHKQKDRIKEKQVHEFYNLAMHIEQNIKEWISEDTITLLSGDEEIKNKLLENITQHDKYLHLCKKLSKLQLEDEKEDEDLMKNTLKPMPHLSILQEEGKKMELKVKAYLKGDMVIETPEQTNESIEQNDDFTAVLPLTDAHDPKALRRRIFLDKLYRILPDLLRALVGSRISQYVYINEKSGLVKALVNTFSLSAKNIIFKTAEWTLVGLIIIKMLSMIDPQLQNLLLTRQASMYISMILMSYKLDSNYLDRLVMELTNVTKVIDADDIKTC